LFAEELASMSGIANDETRAREKLKAKRDRLFQRFLMKPEKTHLAAEIKVIDDQVAECAVQIEGKRISRRTKQA
jgi:hypothetical protein